MPADLIVQPMFNRFYRQYGKRIFDLAVAVGALIVAAPVIALTALVVRWRLGPGVLFIQRRPGLNGKLFDTYKFRTMLEANDDQGRPLPDEQRLTPTGAWLRRLSLDELPQLWNVLRGDISLVGPRPLPAVYLPLYTPEQFRRHELKPGVTGWAVINGRNAISWEEKFRLDVWYVDRVSFWLDLKILFRTAWMVLRQENISAAGHVTMPAFTGTPQKAAQPAQVGEKVAG